MGESSLQERFVQWRKRALTSLSVGIRTGLCICAAAGCAAMAGLLAQVSVGGLLRSSSTSPL
eukprot:7229-Eustigmatos_ZCMA.PRE.1